MWGTASGQKKCPTAEGRRLQGVKVGGGRLAEDLVLWTESARRSSAPCPRGTTEESGPKVVSPCTYRSEGAHAEEAIYEARWARWVGSVAIRKHSPHVSGWASPFEWASCVKPFEISRETRS